MIDRIALTTHVCASNYRSPPSHRRASTFPLVPPHTPKENLMDRRTSAVALFAAVTLAACSPDLVAPIKAPSTLNLSQAVGESGRHIVVVNGIAGKDFASRIEAMGGSVVSYHEGAGIAVVSGLGESAATELVASGVGSVQADFSIEVDVPALSAEADVAEVATEVNSQSNPTTASRYNWQWNMDLVKAPAAWAAGKLGSPNVTVAILDTGLDYDAKDLDGLVDLSRSKSFMDTFVGREDDPSTPTINEQSPIVAPDDTINKYNFATRHLINDLNGHGTNVATQVSSKAVALAGVTSKTTLIGVKVLGANGFGSFSDIMNGVLWAADKGADVANMSLGGGFSKAGNGQSLATINRVFNYARQKGMVIVVSAGNSAIDLQHNGNRFSTYCDAPHVICVSSVGPIVPGGNGDLPAYFTNYGKNSVDIAGPGGNAGTVASAWPYGNGTASFVWSYCPKHRLVITRRPPPNDRYGNLALTTCTSGTRISGFIGTSQAAPHVAGLAALLIAENGKGNPANIKHQIQQSAASIDEAFGRGRIDVRAALGL